jgi:uncharacterized membrane protein
VYSKVKIAGHPVHPMLVCYPVACYTGTLAAFVVYAASGQEFWLNMAIALNVAGLVTAAIAMFPGIVDWALGIPFDSAAKKFGLIHAGFNVTAFGLFVGVLAAYGHDWNGPAASPALGIVLSAGGVGATVAAGFFGWMLVQDYHVGVRLAPEQELVEPVVQQSQPGRLSRHRAA